MKRTILSAAVVVCFTWSAKAQQSTPDIMAAGNPNAPEMKFESEVVDYGTLEHNADGNREFKFKNTGKEPLVISNCQGSCGCTVPTCPKDPIPPGKMGSIKVHYATDRVGAFEKTITVTSNAKEASKVIRIKGVIKPDPQPATPAPATTPAPAPQPAPKN